MTALSLTKTRLRAGIWEGVLVANPVPEAAPVLSLSCAGAPLDGPRLQPDPKSPGRWHVEAAIPAALLSEGMQSFVIQDRATGETLAHFSILVDDAQTDDLQAELHLLRAELELLKRAFRGYVANAAERDASLLRATQKQRAITKANPKPNPEPKAKPKSKTKKSQTKAKGVGGGTQR